jgi:hypothetical protein
MRVTIETVMNKSGMFQKTVESFSKHVDLAQFLLSLSLSRRAAGK